MNATLEISILGERLFNHSIQLPECDSLDRRYRMRKRSDHIKGWIRLYTKKYRLFNYDSVSFNVTTLSSMDENKKVIYVCMKKDQHPIMRNINF